MLGDANAIDYRFTDLAERGPALQSGEIDVMNLTTTWTSNRDINWGNFSPVMFYDGQGFVTRKDTGVESALELDGAAICVTSGTTTELNLDRLLQTTQPRLHAYRFRTDRGRIQRLYV